MLHTVPALKVLQRTLLLMLGSLCAIAVIEGGLRLAGALAPFGRAQPLADDDQFVVLCVGDSHTWGNGTGYPARLAHRLRRHVEGARVVNLGVPGTNTAQLLARAPEWLRRYRADVVIVWSGANNIWNRAQSDHWSAAGVSPAGILRNLLDRSKILRLLRLTRDQETLTRVVDLDRSYTTPAEITVKGDRGKRIWRRELGGREEFFNVSGEHLSPEEQERVTALDITRIAVLAREAGVQFLAITYPQPDDWWQAPSRGVRGAAADAGFPVVSGHEALLRLREERSAVRAFDASVHPSQVLYDEIGDLVYETLVSERLLPPESIPARPPGPGGN